MNRFTLMGNLGNVEYRELESGTKILRLSLATNERIKVGEKWEDKTSWHRLTVFGNRAESLARNLQKGDKILAEGRIEYSQYEKEGQKHYSTDLIVRDIQFANVKGKKTDAGTNEDDNTQDWDQ